ncbi:MAG: NifU N-terminal domain-containing protein [Planctomycetota bacterium]
MPYTIVEQHETPNPAARKFVLDRTIATSPRSYFNQAAARNDPLARAIFEIAGVTNVLLLDNWITICKLPNAPWKEIRSGVERALKGAE